MTIDASVWQSAGNILQAQANLNKLLEAFDLVKCQFPNLAIEYDDSDGGDGEFIQPVWNTYYSVKRSSRRNAKVVAWVTLAIQMTCNEGVAADWNFGKRAKVLVGYCPMPSFDDAWEFDVESPNSAGCLEGCEIDETHWRLDEGRGAISWFYAVPLDQMTSTAAVRRLIAGPLHEILQGSDPQNPKDILKNIEPHLCRPPNVRPDQPEV